MKPTVNFSTVATFFIVISPMFLQYSIFVHFLLFPEFFFLLLLFFALLTNFKLNAWYLVSSLILYLYILSISFFRYFTDNYMNISLAITTSSRLLFYLLLVVIFTNFFKRNFAVKLIIITAFFNSIYGLAQFLSYNLLGITLPWYLPFLNVEHGKKLITDQEYIFESFGFRFSGLFSEPAHFSQYVGFAFLVLIFYKNQVFFNKTVKVIFATVFSISLLLSASGTGFFIIMFLIGSFTLRYIFQNFSIKKFFIGLLSFLAVFSFFIYSLLNSDIFSFGVSRLLSLEDNSSFYVRIVRPILIYADLSPFQQLFGVGYGNFSTYLESRNLFNTYEQSLGFAWTNSLGVFLIGSGLVGTFLIASFYFFSFFKSDSFGRLVVVFLSFHFLFSDLPHTIFFVCFMLFCTSYRNRFSMNLKGE